MNIIVPLYISQPASSHITCAEMHILNFESILLSYKYGFKYIFNSKRKYYLAFQLNEKQDIGE